MARFAQSQNGQLTIIFENFNDLCRFGESIANLIEKYAPQSRTSAILTVFNISTLKEAEAENLPPN